MLLRDTYLSLLAGPLHTDLMPLTSVSGLTDTLIRASVLFYCLLVDTK